MSRRPTLTPEERLARKRERQRRYRANRSPEQVERDREAARRWQRENAEKARGYTRAYAARNPEKVRAKNAAWAARNPEKVRASRRRWDEANPERLREAQRQWRAANRDSLKEKRRQWYIANREHVREYERRRRALQKRGQPPREATMEALNEALGRNQLYAAVAAAVPRTLPRHVRDDAIQATILAVLEGDVDDASIPAYARHAISFAWGMMDKFSGFRSIEATIPGTDGLRLVDTISTEEPHL